MVIFYSFRESVACSSTPLSNLKIELVPLKSGTSFQEMIHGKNTNIENYYYQNNRMVCSLCLSRLWKDL